MASGQIRILPCAPSGTYADLETVVACSIDDKIFGAFSDTIGGIDVLAFDGIGFTASSINYAVYDQNGLEGFTFSFNLPADVEEQFALLYRVDCADFSACIASIHTDLTTTGTGSTSLFESYCPGVDSLCIELPIDPAGLGGSTSAAAVIDPSVPSLGIIKGIDALCGLAGVSAQGEAGCGVTITNTVDQVGRAPEPATLTLLGIGLAGLGYSRRKQ